jgi:CheY-like chemotaxis protein
MGSDTNDTQRILVVDDERIQRLLICRGVEALGFKADAVADLEQAAQRLAERSYDVVLLDLALGETEGSAC